jgi:hypothetical protein
MRSAQEFEDFLARCKGCHVVGFLADKAPQEWEKSTSSKYMDDLWPDSLHYIPIQVGAGREEDLLGVYSAAMRAPNALAFNHTSPHKSNSAMKKLFAPGEGDALIRRCGTFEAVDCNGEAAFLVLKSLSKGQPFSDFALVIAGGMGGSGRLISLAFSKEPPRRLILCDPAQDSAFLQRLEKALGVPAERYASLEALPPLAGPVAFVHAARPPRGGAGLSTLEFLKAYDRAENIALDLQMHPDWEGKSLSIARAGGMEYGLWTNWLLASHLQKAARGLKPLSREEFWEKASGRA